MRVTNLIQHVNSQTNRRFFVLSTSNVTNYKVPRIRKVYLPGSSTISETIRQCHHKVTGGHLNKTICRKFVRFCRTKYPDRGNKTAPIFGIVMHRINKNNPTGVLLIRDESRNFLCHLVRRNPCLVNLGVEMGVLGERNKFQLLSSNWIQLAMHF